MHYLYRVGTAIVVSTSAQIVVMGDQTLATREGVPLVDAMCLAPGARLRKHKRHAAGKTPRKHKRRAPKKPVGDCKKCGRVFFVPQGMSRHIDHCKGEKGVK